MSYIRSTTNPESLYIFGDEKNATVVKGADTIGTIPVKILNGLIVKFLDGHEEDVKHKGAEVKEVWVNENDIELPDADDDKNSIPTKETSVKIKLSYGGWHCMMWYVTWYYIASVNYKNSKRKPRKKKKK